MSRLAIQDLSKNGHQPMWSDDGRYVIVFNGEIYNFKTLRSELVKRGHAFHTGTDTEVLLHLYEAEGADCLSKLNGMFAFAIYDTLSQRLFLARDRFGIKPLYFVRTGKGFFFASEFKALLPFVSELGLDWELDEDRLFEFLMFRHVVGPHTLVKQVAKCLPGTWLTLDRDGGMIERRYYDLENLEPREGESLHALSEGEAIERVKAQLLDSIELRMISDAPLGVALSGGVDSSLLTALLRETRSGPIDTYSVVFEEEGEDDHIFDESPYSDYIAERYETNHHRIRLSQDLFTRNFLKAVWHNDEPLNFPNSLGINLFSQFASKEVKVLLGGEGADEAFGGYGFFGSSDRLTPLKHRVAQPDLMAQYVQVPCHHLDYREHLLGRIGGTGVDREIQYSLYTYLQTVENRLDKMSMACGLEARVPFLDHQLVQLSLRLAPNMKLRGGVTKYVLKKLAERYMPHEQIYRKKIGLSTPLNAWLKKPEHLGQYLAILEEPRTLNRSFVNAGGVKALLRDFREKEDTFVNSMGGRLWILLCLECWLRTFIEDRHRLG